MLETYVVGDPLNEVRRVLVLDVEHLLVNLLHGHASTEHGGDGEVAKITVIFLEHATVNSKTTKFYFIPNLPSVTGITGSHHVLGIEHLLGELRDGERTVLLGSTGSEGSKSGHEKVKTGEGNLKN